MKKNCLWMLAAILTLCGTTTMLTSCASNEDNSVVVNPSDPGPLAETIEGLWWRGYEQKGTIAIPNSDAVKDYTTVIYAYRFYADGGASYMKLLLDEKGEPVYGWGTLYDHSQYTSDNNSSQQGFGYASTADGTITMTNRLADYHDYTPATWQLKYQNGTITGTDGDFAYELVAADDQTKEVLVAYSDKINSGGNGDIDDEVYNTLGDVTYTILKDTAMYTYDVLTDAFHAFNRPHEIEEELKRMRDEAPKPWSPTSVSTRAAGTTRSWWDPKVPYAPSGYRYVDYTYESIDEQGKPITLSARVCWGVTMLAPPSYSEYRPCDLVLCPHSTITDDAEAPSNNGSLDNAMVQGDRVLVMPDYIGYGATRDRVHPYINHDLCAQNSIDALKAGYKIFIDLCDKHTLHPDWKFYVIGASQGGGNALAIHKWLDTHEDFAKLWRFQYSYCAAGPYSPRITFEKYFEQKILYYPCVLPLTLKAMFAAYPDILGKWKEEDFYSEAYLKGKQDIDNIIASKEYESLTLNAQICKLFPYPNDPNIKNGEQIYLADILAPDMYDPASEKRQALFECFDRNDLTKGWTPKHPIHLYHGKNDTYVSYANSEAVVEAFPDMTTLKEPTKEFSDHLKTCILWMLSVKFGLW